MTTPLVRRGSLWMFVLASAAVILTASWLWATPDGRAVLEHILGETPRDKVAAYISAVSRGDEAAALEIWQLPDLLDEVQLRDLSYRRQEVTDDLVAAGIRPRFDVLNVEWWRTCCELGVADDARGAGGARIHVKLLGANGASSVYVIDVFVRDLPYWGSALGYPLRHWVIRDVYKQGERPLFWRVASGAGVSGKGSARGRENWASGNFGAGAAQHLARADSAGWAFSYSCLGGEGNIGSKQGLPASAERLSSDPLGSLAGDAHVYRKPVR